MTRFLLTAACLAVTFSVSGCKIVKNIAPETAEAAADASGDDVRVAALVAETYVPRLVPEVTRAATDMTTLRAAIAAGLDAAGETYGLRAVGEGAAWNFAVKGRGVVIAADREARAAKLELDSDGDGQADTTIQLGPVVKGTALRDIAPFYVFTDFRDQIEFAKLARALNDAASAAVSLPAGDLTGRTVSFTGAFSLRVATDPALVVPVALSIGAGQ